MKQRVILVGNSALSFFLAQEIDRELGALAHLELVWLTDSPDLVHLSGSDNLLSSRFPQTIKGRFRHLKPLHQEIKSVNLADRRVVTSRTVFDYDYLIIDETPVYTPAELVTIRQQVTSLLATTQANFHLGKAVPAHIHSHGTGPESWQMALLIRRAINRHYPTIASLVEVSIDRPALDIERFLRREKIKVGRSTKSPGLSIQAPALSLPYSRVKGLKVGLKGRPLIGKQATLSQYPEAVLFDQEALQYINILRVVRSVSRQVANQLKSRLGFEAIFSLELPEHAVLLKGNGQFLLLGKRESTRTQALVVRQLDRMLARQLKSGAA